jgi:serine-type D-Ala-D-Ala carboxypeptidase (penicillin-binding protein 5/6)
MQDIKAFDLKVDTKCASGMIKKIVSSITILAISLLAPFDLSVSYAASLVPITATSAILLDASSQKVVFSKTPHLRRAPASTTKILTSIVALENLELDRYVTVPGYVEKMEPSKIYLRRGEKYRTRDLVRAILLNSANDAAEVLAYAGGGGSRANFAAKMNAKAKSLGCERSNFVNPSGLPNPSQYSTAYDMALIMREAQSHPFIVETMQTRTMTIRSQAGRKIALKNHNKMLWRDHREVIGKTGWTRKAKHCFVGAIRANHREVFVSMLGSRRLWRDLKTLVDYQFGASYIKIRKNKKNWSRDHRKRIQTALKRAGYNPGSVDGQFGPTTIKAIRKFQKAHGMKPDGIVGTSTWKKLQAYG